MTNILLTLSIFVGFAFHASAAEIVNGTVQMKQVSVMKDGHPARADVRTAEVSIAFSGGKSGLAEIAMLYEPQSRLFWWRYQTIESERTDTGGENPLGDFIVYIAGEKVYGFSFSKPFLWIRESTEQVSSMDEGQTAVLAEINSKVVQIESGTATWARAVNVGVALVAMDPDFAILRGSASPSPGPKLRSVARADGQWRLTLDGPNKDSAEVVLSDDYDVVSTKHFPPTGQ